MFLCVFCTDKLFCCCHTHIKSLWSDYLCRSKVNFTWVHPWNGFASISCDLYHFTGISHSVGDKVIENSILKAFYYYFSDVFRAKQYIYFFLVDIHSKTFARIPKTTSQKHVERYDRFCYLFYRCLFGGFSTKSKMIFSHDKQIHTSDCRYRYRIELSFSSIEISFGIRLNARFKPSTAVAKSVEKYV